MTTAAADLLLDGFGRVRARVHDVLDGATPELLAWRPDPAANPVGWLVWHLLRVQDDHVAGVAGTGQVWSDDGWSQRIDSGHEPGAIGYGDDATAVGRLRVGDPAALAGYADAVLDRTVAFVRTLSDDDLTRVVDEHWDPPVTLAVRLVSVVDDDLEHVGQAAYVRGLYERAH